MPSGTAAALFGAASKLYAAHKDEIKGAAKAAWAEHKEDIKGAAKNYGTQLAGAAKAGLNARVATTATGVQTKIAGAPPTPTPMAVQPPTNVKPPTFTF
jgi:hypothetical protein